MKHQMMVAGLAGTVALTWFCVARAGLKQTYSVTASSTSASGSLGSARNTSDSVQYIGCTSTSNGSGARATCMACPASGTCRSCTTSNAGHIKAIRGLKGDSYVSFGINSNGSCSSIYVEQESYQAPKAP